MKNPFRIRCFFLALVTFASIVSSLREWSECGIKREMICLVHASCLGFDGEMYSKLKMKVHSKSFKMECARYIIVSGVDSNKVHIEVHDGTMNKDKGLEVNAQSSSAVFQCVKNVASTTDRTKFIITDVHTSNSDTNIVHCELDVSTPDGTDNVYTTLKSRMPWVVKNMATSVTADADLDNVDGIIPCAWDSELFRTGHPDSNEDSFPLDVSKDFRKCSAGYLWFSANDEPWKRIDSFFCKGGEIMRIISNVEHPIDKLAKNRMKCAKPKCGHCTCPFCNADNAPNFTATEGTRCAKMTCTTPNMLVNYGTSSAVALHKGTTLSCSAKSTADKPQWEGPFSTINNVTCVKEVKCSELGKRIKTACPKKKKGEAETKECQPAKLHDDGSDVCDKEFDITYLPLSKIEKTPKSFKCDKKSGQWVAVDAANEEIRVYEDTSVYCLKKAAEKQEQTSSAGLGTTIVIVIVVVAIIAIAIIVVVAIFVCRNRIKNKRDKVDLKSVSVTGRSKKGKNDKKKNSQSSSKISSKSGSKSSEQSSMPPEPAAPPIPDPIPDPSSQPAAAAAVPVVGPDTGKPDRPAVLVDILPSSSHMSEKASEKRVQSSKQGPPTDATVANTVTGTTFDRSRVDPEPSGDTTKKEAKKKEVDESMMSDTGRQTKEATRKSKKDRKVDKKGRGLTDDDEYDIGEGAKPVKHEDKNKKEYVPKRNTKMINVTADTEDQDLGALKAVDNGPRRKKS